MISVSILDRQGYTFHFGRGKVDIFSNSVFCLLWIYLASSDRQG